MDIRLLALLLLIAPCWGQLPNHKLTPGAIRTTSRKGICSPDFRTGPFRHTTDAQKKQVCREYGVKRCPKYGEMEIDHLIPLELGGADEVSNLWPEFAKYQVGPGFHVKDLLENTLRRKVCAGEMPLPEAQECLRRNWVRCYARIVK